MLFCIPHQSLMMRQSPQWVTVRRPTRLKSAVSTVGDSKLSSAVDDISFHTQPSQVLALTSRCQMWLHVAYGV